MSERGSFWTKQCGRREFLTRSAQTLAGLTLAGCSRPSLPPAKDAVQNSEVFTDSECQKLGKELSAWQLSTGAYMAGFFPEVRLAADILIGTVNPRKYLPFLKIPITFNGNSQNDGQFVFTFVPAPEDKRTVTINVPSGKAYEYHWTSHECPASLGLSPEIMNSTGRFPIITKEVSQIYDYPEYARLYLNLAKDQGVKLTFNNPENIPTAQEEVDLNFANSLDGIERDFSSETLLHLLIDIGSGIKVGGIIYANWYIDQLRKKQPIPQRPWTDMGSTFGGLLQEKGWITEEKYLFAWKKGTGLKIVSPDFLALYKALSPRTTLILH